MLARGDVVNVADLEQQRSRSTLCGFKDGQADLIGVVSEEVMKSGLFDGKNSLKFSGEALQHLLNIQRYLRIMGVAAL